MNDQESRFWARVDKRGPNECWEWTGGRKGHGYGQVFFNSKNMRTHRLSWVLKNGPIPPDLYVCHRCDNPPCVNPEHLYLGTQKQNIREAQEKGRLYNHYKDRTHCKSGHLLSEENTVIGRDGRQNSYRQCRICFRKMHKEWKTKNKDRINAGRREKRAQLRAAKITQL